MANRILVVDDEPAVRAAVVRLLEIHGYEVSAAASATEALAALESSPQDVVVTDWEMGGMSGDELCRRIRESTHPPLPVVLLSGSTPSEDETQCFAAVIRKSAPPAALISELQRLTAPRGDTSSSLNG